MLRSFQQALNGWRTSLAELAPGAMRWLRDEDERLVLVEADGQVRLGTWADAELTDLEGCQWPGALSELPEQAWEEVKRQTRRRRLHLVLSADKSLQLSWSVPPRVTVDAELVRNGLLQRSPLDAAAAQIGWRSERSASGEQIVHVALCQRTEFRRLADVLRAQGLQDWVLVGPGFLTRPTAPAIHQRLAGWRSWLPGARLALLISLFLMPLAVCVGQAGWSLYEADRFEAALQAKQEALAGAQAWLVRDQAAREAQQALGPWAAVGSAGGAMAVLSKALAADASYLELRQEGNELALRGVAAAPAAVLEALALHPAAGKPQLRLRDAPSTQAGTEFEISLQWEQRP